MSIKIYDYDGRMIQNVSNGQGRKQVGLHVSNDSFGRNQLELYVDHVYNSKPILELTGNSGHDIMHALLANVGKREAQHICRLLAARHLGIGMEYTYPGDMYREDTDPHYPSRYATEAEGSELANRIDNLFAAFPDNQTVDEV